MIVATAGHVDHGKTLLIKALTGVDADRLPEEKKRGMTIDLGFASIPVGSGESIGFVDVPGHERFIHNMLCGLGGIDFVLFVVAADDGPMPQTIEHLGILDLLGVDHGVAAITKVDRVSSARAAEVETEVSALFAKTCLANVPVFPVSAVTGAGIGCLKQHLQHIARNSPTRASSGNFRLAIDRCFGVVGAGLVVTGTAISGSVAVGDQVRVLLADISARVRGIHVHGSPSRSGRPGQRVALNLAGPDLKHGAITRGDWVVGGEAPPATRKVDAAVRVLNSETRDLAHWTPVHVHLGAADVTGRVAVLEGSSIPAGRSGLIQLVLDRPVGAWRSDRLIIRDQSAQRTIGGGQVIDGSPPARGRAKPERLTFLQAMSGSDDTVALVSLLEAATRGLDLARFAANRNLTADEARRLFAQVPMRVVPVATGALGFSLPHWDHLKITALELLAAWHRRAPDTIGPSEDRLFSGSDIKLPRIVSVAVVDELAREHALIKQGMTVRLPTHQPMLKSADAALWKEVTSIFDRSEMRPPTINEVANATGHMPKRIESLLTGAARQGHLIRLSQSRFCRPAILQHLAEVAETVAKESETGSFTVSAFRDRTEIGRNLAIEVLEYFDRIKFTQRVGDVRKVLRSGRDALGRNGQSQLPEGSCKAGRETHPGGAPGLQIR